MGVCPGIYKGKVRAKPSSAKGRWKPRKALKRVGLHALSVPCQCVRELLLPKFCWRRADNSEELARGRARERRASEGCAREGQDMCVLSQVEPSEQNVHTCPQIDGFWPKGGQRVWAKRSTGRPALPDRLCCCSCSLVADDRLQRRRRARASSPAPGSGQRRAKQRRGRSPSLSEPKQEERCQRTPKETPDQLASPLARQ